MSMFKEPWKVMQELWPKGPAWSSKAWPRCILSEQKRFTKNEYRRSYHFSVRRTSHHREREKWRKRRWREDIKEYCPKEAAEMREKDATRKRKSRSKMSDEALTLARQKHAGDERRRIANLSPERASEERCKKAKNERKRRVAKSELIQSIDRYNNTVRMRASRDGKKLNRNALLHKDIFPPEELNGGRKKRYRRSPETRNKHAQYEHKRMDSMSPSKAAEGKKLKTEQQKERRKNMSEAEKRTARQKNTAAMKRRRHKSKNIVLQTQPSVRKNFTINWTWGFPPKYFTKIDGKEYVQYRMHAFMIGNK